MNQPPGGGWGGGQPPGGGWGGGAGQPGGFGQPPGGGDPGQYPGGGYGQAPGGYGGFGQGPYNAGPVPGGQGGGTPPTEVLALVSLVTGIASIPATFCCTFFSSPVSLVAIVTGVLALMKISKSSEQLKGKELAIGGIVTGALGILVMILFIALGVAGALLGKR
jgi:hypothetical protein